MFDMTDSDDADDDWFYESIRRYDDLLMYNIHGVISCAVFRNDDRLLLASSRENVHEIAELTVPEKLIAGEHAGLTNNRDFRVVTAGYTVDHTKEMLVIDSSVVLSGPKGVCVYQIPDSNDSSDVISPTYNVRNDVADPSLAECGTKFYSGSNILNITVFDLTTTKGSLFKLVPNQVTVEGSADTLNISNIFCRNEKVYTGLQERGAVFMCDSRTGSIEQEINSQIKTTGRWKSNVSNDEKFIGLTNSMGSVSIYDTRNVNQALLNRVMEVESEKQYHQLQFCPSGSLFSLSGYNSYVEVFTLGMQTQNVASSIFSHDGHRDRDVHSILSHIWHPSQSRLIFSADNTGTLQAWRYIPAE